ncbi:hypothetical protein LIER_16557 [Lithospermum erythrorhizon]|uniref:RNase H type-1 domain-containing protein n=1 Tax=Lithospermum erythrorhizon TaxID=34254 RepID=A0AAV3Q737_LITER
MKFFLWVNFQITIQVWDMLLENVLKNQTKLKIAYENDNFDRESMLILEKELGEAWDEEEAHWQTKAKIQYLKTENNEGSWEDGADEVENIVVEYFGQIFNANEVCNPEKATFAIENRVTSAMNCQLTRAVTSEEVRKAVFEMSPDKSPVPDEGLTCMLREVEERRVLTGETLEHRFFRCPAAARFGICPHGIGELMVSEDGKYKLNCDASFFKDHQRGSVGAIVRDGGGEFVGASFRSIPFVSHASIAEALAIREGLELAETWME